MDFDKDVVVLAAFLRREALCMLTKATGAPLRGLSSGCGRLAISNGMKKKLRNIDVVVGWVEKLSRPLINQFLEDLRVELDAAEAAGANGKSRLTEHKSEKTTEETKQPEDKGEKDKECVDTLNAFDGHLLSLGPGVVPPKDKKEEELRGGVADNGSCSPRLPWGSRAVTGQGPTAVRNEGVEKDEQEEEWLEEQCRMWKKELLKSMVDKVKVQVADCPHLPAKFPSLVAEVEQRVDEFRESLRMLPKGDRQEFSVRDFKKDKVCLGSASRSRSLSHRPMTHKRGKRNKHVWEGVGPAP